MAALAVSSCAGNFSESRKSTQNEFVKQTPSSEIPFLFEGNAVKLTRAGSTKHESVIYRLPDPWSQQAQLSAEPLVPTSRLIGYDFRFGHVTKEQFELLSRSYGGMGTDRFSEDREYSLVDFLPPRMQAVVNHGFKFMRLPLPESITSLLKPTREFEVRTKVSFETNCWSTAYALSLPWDGNYTAFLGNEFQVERVFFNADYAKPIGAVKPDSKCKGVGCLIDSAIQDNLEFGDVLVVVNESNNVIRHAAVFLDKDVYFEKSANATNYRIVHASTLTSNWASESSSFRFIRPNESNRVFPHPAEIFTMNHGEVPLWRDEIANADALQRFRAAEAQARVSLPSELAKATIGSHYYAGREKIDDSGRKFKEPFVELVLSGVKDFKLEIDEATGRYSLPQAAFASDSYQFK